MAGAEMKAACIILILLALVALVGSMAQAAIPGNWSDNFSTNIAGNYAATNGLLSDWTWDTANTRIFTAPVSTTHGIKYVPSIFGDGIYTVWVNITDNKTPSYTHFKAFGGSLDQYLYFISPTYYFSDGTYSDLVVIQNNTRYNITLSKVGTTEKTYFNGVLKRTNTITNFAPGYVGLSVYWAPDGVYFDNLSVASNIMAPYAIITGANQTSGVAPLPVVFTDGSYNTPTMWNYSVYS